MMESVLGHRDRNRWHQLVTDIFNPHLSSAELQKVLLICDEGLTSDHEDTAAAFCQRLTEACPEIEIDKQTRLQLLRTLRQHQMAGTSKAMSSHQSVAMTTTMAPSSLALTFREELTPANGRRHESRKFTNLVGKYQCRLGEQQSGAMVIENLSMSGCGLQILTQHRLTRGALLRLEFNLDDMSSTLIHIHGRVSWTLHESVGVDFQRPDDLPRMLSAYIAS